MNSPVIASMYASNLGQLVVNLTGRGYLIKLSTEKNLFNNDILYLQVVDMKTTKSTKYGMSEAEIEAIQDVSIIADAIVERLRKA